MTGNILIKVQAQSSSEFEYQNPLLAPGEIALTIDKNIAKIGDGIKQWKQLEQLPVTEKTIQDWLFFLNKTSSAHLVTLPDINFAYLTVNADSNFLIDQALSLTIKPRNYIKIDYSKITLPGSSPNLGMPLGYGLSIYTPEESIFDFILDESFNNTQEILINSISFSSKKTQNTIAYTFADKDARERISILENKTFPVMFDKSITGSGLVKSPESDQANILYFLNGANRWSRLYGSEIKLTKSEDSLTIKEAIDQTPKTNKLKDDDKGTYYLIGTPFDESKNTLHYFTGPSATDKTGGIYMTNKKLYGASGNDYAECRETKNIQAGRVVIENGDDTLSLSNDRLLLGGNIVSDTYSMLIGETEKAKTPIAICGRVLAYPNEDISDYYAGAPVCTGPNGTVSLMSKEEVLHYPECIIGYVSAIPIYEKWNNIDVNGRIWIKVI